MQSRFNRRQPAFGNCAYAETTNAALCLFSAQISWLNEAKMAAARHFIDGGAVPPIVSAEAGTFEASR